jgi:expansin (peptidoglycan-binding protein)
MVVAWGLALAPGCGDEGSGGSPGTNGGTSNVGGSTAGAPWATGGAGSSSTLRIDDPLFATPTDTVAEYITPEYYACETEQSACGLPCPDDSLWVAINSTDFRGSRTCSACMEVTGPLGSVTVEVVENCAGACSEGEIELSREAFELIADAAEGHADVSWRLVPCQRIGPIAFAYEPDSDEWFAGIQIRNPALPIAELDIRFSDEVGWVTLEMDGWNHFPISDDLGSGPFDFRVRAIDGQQLVEEDIEYVPGGVVQGTSQFDS